MFTVTNVNFLLWSTRPGRSIIVLIVQCEVEGLVKAVIKELDCVPVPCPHHVRFSLWKRQMFCPSKCCRRSLSESVFLVMGQALEVTELLKMLELEVNEEDSFIF